MKKRILLLMLLVSVIAYISFCSALQTSTLTVNLELKSATVNYNTGLADIQVHRPIGEADVVGLHFVFFNGVESKSTEIETQLSELETKTVSVLLPDIADISEIRVAVIVNADGENLISGIKDTIYSEDIEIIGVYRAPGTLSVEEIVGANVIVEESSCLGDANLDDSVNLNDLVAIARNWHKSPAKWQDGNFNDDKIVDLSDLVTLARNWNRNCCDFEISGCQYLDQEGKTYCLSEDVVENELGLSCMNIRASNVVLNCKNKWITGNDYTSGIYSDQQGTKIKNCNVDMGIQGAGVDFRGSDAYIFKNNLNGQNIGLKLLDANNVFVEKLNVDSNTYAGVFVGNYLGVSSNILLKGVEANLNSQGIELGSSSYVTIQDSVVTNSDSNGISLSQSSNNLITGVTSNENEEMGITMYRSSNNLLSNVITRGNSDTGLLIRDFSENNHILNLITEDNWRGVRVLRTNYNTFEDVHACNNANLDFYCFDTFWTENQNTFISNDCLKRFGCPGLGCEDCMG